MQLGIIEIASLITIFQILLLTIFLLSHRKKTVKSDRFLAAFLFTFAILIYSSFVFATSLMANKTHMQLAFFAGISVFLVGPFFYFYIQSVLSNSFSLDKKQSIHLFPFLFLISFPFIARLLPFKHAHQIFSFLVNGGICVHLSLYIIASLRVLKQHGLNVRKFTAMKNPNFSWIIFLFYGVVSICIFKIMIFVGWHVTRVGNICQYMTTTFFLITFIFINTIVYMALKKTELFAHKNKYNQSALNESKKQLILNHLRKIMGLEKPHLQPSISLPELAQLLSVPKHHLSQVINESFHLNFNDFINKYRIEEALTLLQNKTNDGKTILEIAFSVGFNSKSTFNSAFKKHTGQTPKEFKTNGNVHPGIKKRYV